MIRRLGLRTRLRRAARFVLDTRHRLTTRRINPHASDDYRRYLGIQLSRTLSKRRNDPGVGARVLSRELVTAGMLDSSSSILCLGCRNSVELDLFRKAGVGNVIGIDLFSQRADILVMDMHAMTFPDQSFDAVYCSHVLEHAFDLELVLSEIKRVARPGAVVGVEVPLGDRRSEADRIEFQTLADLQSTVAPIVVRELWADEQPARSPSNEQGTAIARLVFSVRDAPPA